MVFNPPLILVSALFFVALSAAFYLIAWLMAAGVLRLGGSRLSHLTRKRILMAGLLLPPMLAALPTLAGVTMRHSHAVPMREHHSLACLQTFEPLLHPADGVAPAGAMKIAGFLAYGAAWALAAIGALLFVRLLVATVRLERGLTPYLRPPSDRLSGALGRVGEKMPGFRASNFYECPIPAAYSSVIGLWRPRCVLSEELVRSATDAELDAVIAHETAHIRGRDVAGTLLVSSLRCLFFYLLPARALARGWREEAELSCDEYAAAVTGQPLALAAALLRATGVPVGQAPRAAILGFADEAACSTAKRVELLIASAETASFACEFPSRPVLLWVWLLTVGFSTVGISSLLSPQATCVVHCSLEAIARQL